MSAIDKTSHSLISGHRGHERSPRDDYHSNSGHLNSESNQNTSAVLVLYGPSL